MERDPAMVAAETIVKARLRQPTNNQVADIIRQAYAEQEEAISRVLDAPNKRELLRAIAYLRKLEESYGKEA